jgi:hypothetical protein
VFRSALIFRGRGPRSEPSGPRSGAEVRQPARHTGMVRAMTVSSGPSVPKTPTIAANVAGGMLLRPFLTSKSDF